MNSLKVADYMHRYPVTFTADMPIEMAVDRLIQAKQLGGPVIDAERNIIGFISEQDCLSQMLMSTYHNQQSSKVMDAMHKEVLTVRPYEDIIDLAQLMLLAKPKLYPVVDDNECLIGIISRTDVLAAIDKELHSHYGKVT
ncbi:CBS domain-containing protein [Rheinheimera sp. MMS21-TC3]|uniref:CBS domain-containing protein n=1 Tax=Rheinheimera sp. MMS21-TC3 TaxID=3072790 RepID=UPI0028C38FF8|nr:CBS domain-containing protein [Rheinheimera sp. MMS21-TC3]WNO60841.1 CBS domain-containing protein [Rheinheimera sp. MMS21-TC3]